MLQFLMVSDLRKLSEVYVMPDQVQIASICKPTTSLQSNNDKSELQPKQTGSKPENSYKPSYRVQNLVSHQVFEQQTKTTFH